MGKYIVGDKIKLKNDFCFGDIRDSYKGGVATITGVHPLGAPIYRLDIDGQMFSWPDDVIEGLVEGYHPHKLDVKIVLLDLDMTPPNYAHYNDSGFDCVSRVDITINPGEVKLVPLGFKIAVPTGFELQVRPRSGLALKQSITLENCVGTVDSGYRNEISAIVHNEGSEPFLVTKGMKICQGVIAPVYKANFNVVTSLDETERGLNGFGSSGV